MKVLFGLLTFNEGGCELTVSELKCNVEQGSDSLFFTRDTMKFFGDTMSNYGIRSARVDTYSEQEISVWELYRRQPVKHGLQDSAYFNKETFSRVFAKRN